MAQTPTSETSSAINLIRPLLVLFMMLAHLFVLDHAAVLKAAQPLNAESWVIALLKSALAKSGVPLLSLISGYLALYSLHNYGYWRVLLRKLRRLVWPMVWSNLLFILLITWPAQAGDPTERPDLSIHPFDLYGWFQATFAFYKLPANQPLFFLKDLFTCFLLLPLLLAVARIRYLNVAVLIWMAYKCIYLKPVFLVPVYPLWFFRFDIVLAFYCGLLLALHGKSLVIGNRQLNRLLALLFVAVCVLASAVYVLLARDDHRLLFLWLDFLVKVLSVVGCVGLMSLLIARRGVMAGLLRCLSPYSYTMFLTHAFSFTFFHRAYIHLFGRPEILGPSGLLYLIGIYLAGIGVAVAALSVWRKGATWASTWA